MHYWLYITRNILYMCILNVVFMPADVRLAFFSERHSGYLHKSKAETCLVWLNSR